MGPASRAIADIFTRCRRHRACRFTEAMQQGDLTYQSRKQLDVDLAPLVVKARIVRHESSRRRFGDCRQANWAAAGPEWAEWPTKR